MPTILRKSVLAKFFLRNLSSKTLTSKELCSVTLGWSIFLPLLLLTTSCAHDDDDDDDDTGAASAYIRFVNLSPDSPDIELELDDDYYAQKGFREATGRISIQADTYAATTNLVLPDSKIANITAEESISFANNRVNSYIMVGSSDAPETLNIETDVTLIESDDFDDNIARIQFLHAAADFPQVDIYITDAGDDLLNQTPAASLSYKDASGYQDVDSGRYRIQVTNVGTKTAIFDSDDILVSTGEVLMFALVNVRNVTDTNARLSMVELDDSGARIMNNDAQPTYLRFNNAISDVGVVDVYLDDPLTSTPVFSNVLFGDISPQIEVLPDEYEISITVAASPAELIYDTDIETFSDEQLLITGAGEYLNDEVKVNLTNESLRPIATHAVISFTHAASYLEDDAIEVVLTDVGANPSAYNPQMENVSYLSNDSFELEAGRYELYFFNEDGGGKLLGPKRLSIEAGEVINITATDSEGGGGPVVAQIATN